MQEDLRLVRAPAALGAADAATAVAVAAATAIAAAAAVAAVAVASGASIATAPATTRYTLCDQPLKPGHGGRSNCLPLPSRAVHAHVQLVLWPRTLAQRLCLLHPGCRKHLPVPSTRNTRGLLELLQRSVREAARR